MNSLSCCASCSDSKVGSLFSMGAYVPATPGYGQSFSAYPDPSRITGITPVGVAGPCMGENVPRPCNWEMATLGAYDRGQGNPSPYYPLSAYSKTGNPTQFRPMNSLSGYSDTGNPTQFRPMNSAGNGTQPMSIGSGVQPLGFWVPLVTAGLGLAAIAGATYVANSGVQTALAPETAAALADPLVKTTSSIATTAVVALVAYALFKKDIKRLMK